MSFRALVVCLVVAASLPIAARLVAGPRGAIVHVRWADLDVSDRETREAMFGLRDAEPLGGSTWRYDLVAPSEGILRALVIDPAIEDTQHIDRRRFVLSDTERTSRRGRFAQGDVVVSIADGLAIVLLSVGFLRIDGVRSARRSIVLPIAHQWADQLASRKTHLTPCVGLSLLLLAVYATALWFPPTNGDDLSYLSSISTIHNPLAYFVQDAGAGGNVYRPLLPLGMWLVYQVVGVWAMPNQAINLALHLINVLLLYRIIERERTSQMIAFLFAAVFAVSPYTYATAAWVSDRPMAFTGFFVLLFVDYLSRRAHAGAPVRLATVAALSVGALLSKESGLVVPAVGLLVALRPGSPLVRLQRVRLAALTLAIILGYIGFRALIFGANLASYTQDGYMFLGWMRYNSVNELPPALQYVNFVENILKNTLAPVLPVFADGGQLRLGRELLSSAPVILSTVILGWLAARRLTDLQWIALMIIVTNAVAHFALFRFRLHYLSHAAFCVFIAGSPIIEHARKRQLVQVLAVVVLAGGLLSTSFTLDRWTLLREAEFTLLETQGVARYGHVAQQILDLYR